jgi:hypothetical protein
MENNLVTVSPGLYKRVLRLMGNMFEITVVADDGAHAKESTDAAIAEMQRIERLLQPLMPPVRQIKSTPRLVYDPSR